MTTAVGTVVLNLASVADADPYTNPDYTVYPSSTTVAVNSNQLQVKGAANTEGFLVYNHGSIQSEVSCEVEVSQASTTTGGYVGAALTNSAGDGYIIQVTGGTIQLGRAIKWKQSTLAAESGDVISTSNNTIAVGDVVRITYNVDTGVVKGYLKGTEILSKTEAIAPFQTGAMYGSIYLQKHASVSTGVTSLGITGVPEATETNLVANTLMDYITLATYDASASNAIQSNLGSVTIGAGDTFQYSKPLFTDETLTTYAGIEVNISDAGIFTLQTGFESNRPYYLAGYVHKTNGSTSVRLSIPVKIKNTNLITTQPVDVQAWTGNGYEFTVVPAESGVAIQWQTAPQSTPSKFTVVSGATQATYQSPTSEHNLAVRAKVTKTIISGGNTTNTIEYSDPAELSLHYEHKRSKKKLIIYSLNNYSSIPNTWITARRGNEADYYVGGNHGNYRVDYAHLRTEFSNTSKYPATTTRTIPGSSPAQTETVKIPYLIDIASLTFSGQNRYVLMNTVHHIREITRVIKEVRPDLWIGVPNVLSEYNPVYATQSPILEGYQRYIGLCEALSPISHYVDFIAPITSMRFINVDTQVKFMETAIRASFAYHHNKEVIPMINPRWVDVLDATSPQQNSYHENREVTLSYWSKIVRVLDKVDKVIYQDQVAYTNRPTQLTLESD